MTRRLAKLTAWLALGAVVLSGLFWLLINTPESNVLMLAASAILILIMLIAVAVVVNTAVLMAPGRAFRTSLGVALRGVAWFAVAVTPALLLWWTAVRGDAWVLRHAGEINAWFIAQLGWGDISRLFEAQTWISRWLRWVVGPLASLSLLAGVLTHGASALVSRRWMGRALHWRTLGLASLVFVTLFVLPWQLAQWRPELPPTWLQPVVAGARLAVVALSALVGCALLVVIAGSAESAPSPTPVA